MEKLNDIDRTIVKLLQEDAKMNVKEIAARLNMSKTPVYDRIKRLEKEGVIRKYVALLNKKKVSTSMVVFCSVYLDAQTMEEIHLFNERVSHIPEVVECYLMGGVFDYMLKVIVEDLDAYHVFSAEHLAALPNIKQIKSFFVLNEVKYTTAIPMK